MPRSMQILYCSGVSFCFNSSSFFLSTCLLYSIQLNFSFAGIRAHADSCCRSGNTSRSWRTNLVREFGEPEENPEFWDSISATSYLSEISGPLQLHHGKADHSVPPAFSIKLNDLMQKAGQVSELYTYPGDDHDISSNLSLALSRSVAFFDKYLK